MKAALAAILTLFFSLYTELKDPLTWNLVGSIEMNCRSKMAKIIQIMSEMVIKCIFRFSWTKMPIDMTLGSKHLGDK